MPSKLDEQELAGMLEDVSQSIRDKKKIQGPATSVKFLGAQRCRGCQEILSKVKDKLLHLSVITAYHEGGSPMPG